MVTRKAAATTIGADAATFDADAWIRGLRKRGMKPANVKVRMHFRADLVPRLAELKQEIEQMENGPEREIGVDEADPYGAAVAEFNALQAEFEAGGFEEFEFRPRNRRIHLATFAEWQDKFTDETDPEKRQLVLMRMAATCLSHPGITPAAFETFEDEYGDMAMASLQNGFIRAYSAGGEPDADFLRPRSPTRGTAKSSND